MLAGYLRQEYRHTLRVYNIFLVFHGNSSYLNLPQCYIIYALPISFQSILRSSNLSSLPDRGTRLQMSLTEKQNKLKKLKDQWQSSNFNAVPGKCRLSKTFNV